jgi:hypothetical protein
MSEHYQSQEDYSAGPPPVDMGVARKRARARAGQRLFNQARGIDAEGPKGREKHQEELKRIRDQITKL